MSEASRGREGEERPKGPSATYSRSVNREIAVLRHLSHPGVARLVSAFRFRDGAHLVLEYASGGDLHALVTENGSLDEPSARFACGEVLAALCDVQAKGLVYGDLKPENVLVTESGHFKLGDFGGCRAVVTAAVPCGTQRRSGGGGAGEATPAGATGGGLDGAVAAAVRRHDAGGQVHGRRRWRCAAVPRAGRRRRTGSTGSRGLFGPGGRLASFRGDHGARHGAASVV